MRIPLTLVKPEREIGKRIVKIGVRQSGTGCYEYTFETFFFQLFHTDSLTYEWDSG